MSQTSAPPTAPRPAEMSVVAKVLIVWGLTLAAAGGAWAALRHYQFDILRRIEYVDAPDQRKADLLQRQADRRFAKLQAAAGDSAGKLSGGLADEAKRIAALYREAESLRETNPSELYARLSLVCSYLGDEQAAAIAKAHGDLADRLWDSALASANEAGGVEGMLVAVEAHAGAGRLDEADAVAKSLAEEFPRDARANYALAEVAEARGQWRQAAAAWAAGLAKDEGNVPALLRMASACEVDGADLDGAEAALQEARQRQPRNPEIHHRLGLVQLRQGKAAEAESSIREAAALLPNHFDLWWDLRRACQAAGDETEAARALQRAVALDGPRASRLIDAAAKP